MAFEENQTPSPMDLLLPFAGEGAFQKTAWAVGKIYSVFSSFFPASVFVELKLAIPVKSFSGR